MRFFFVLLFLVNFNELAWSRPQNTNPDPTQDKPKESYVEKSQFRWNVPPTSLVVNTPKPINVTSHFIDTDWTNKIIHEVVHSPNHYTDVKPIYLTNNPSAQDKWTFHFDSPHEDIKEASLFPQGDIFELISLLEMETDKMRTSTNAPKLPSSDQLETSTQEPVAPSQDPTETTNEVHELPNLDQGQGATSEPQRPSLDLIGISEQTLELPSFELDQLPENVPSRPSSADTLSNPVQNPSAAISNVPRPSRPLTASPPSNAATPSFSPIGAMMSVSAVSAATALYGVAATLPVWLPVVLGRRKKRDVFMKNPLDPTIRSLVRANGVKEDKDEKKPPNQEKIVNHIKGLLNGFADSDKQGLKSVSPEGDINNALSPIKALDAMKETIQVTNTLKSQNNQIMPEKTEPKEEKITTNEQDKTETGSSTKTGATEASKASVTTVATTTTIVTTPTTTTTTTTTRTTTTRRTTTTTTRRTTTTTNRPIAVTSPPGMLARIGNMVQGSIGNLGTNLVAGSSFLAAAASPILFQMVLGKKKRRKRSIIAGDNKKVDKIMSYNSRFLQPVNTY